MPRIDPFLAAIPIHCCVRHFLIVPRRAEGASDTCAWREPGIPFTFFTAIQSTGQWHAHASNTPFSLHAVMQRLCWKIRHFTTTAQKNGRPVVGTGGHGSNEENNCSSVSGALKIPFRHSGNDRLQNYPPSDVPTQHIPFLGFHNSSNSTTPTHPKKLNSFCMDFCCFSNLFYSESLHGLPIGLI